MWIYSLETQITFHDNFQIKLQVYVKLKALKNKLSPENPKNIGWTWKKFLVVPMNSSKLLIANFLGKIMNTQTFYKFQRMQ